jgi:hypothetical protein
MNTGLCSDKNSARLWRGLLSWTNNNIPVQTGTAEIDMLTRSSRFPSHLQCFFSLCKVLMVITNSFYEIHRSVCELNTVFRGLNHVPVFRRILLTSAQYLELLSVSGQQQQQDNCSEHQSMLICRERERERIASSIASRRLCST